MRHLFLISFLIIPLVFISCTKKPNLETNAKPRIVATIFPHYDWLSEIAKGSDSFDISLLVSNGTDLHSFNPSASDIIKISTCDVFVYVGGESDDWVEEVLRQAKNKEMLKIKLLDLIKENAKKEEIVEGMQGEIENDGDSEENEAFDEHIWLSVKNASLIIEKLSDILCGLEKDEKKITLYKNNARNYIEKLSALDENFANSKKSFSKNAFLVADRFPFLYFSKDYDLKYFAAFQGCSAETEASFETVAFLTRKVDELNLDYVLTIDGGDKKLAKTIIANSNRKNCEILTLDSLQSVTKKEIESGKNYLDSMKNNFEIIENALN